jgi:dTDP-glucose pyrophosphorylase
MNRINTIILCAGKINYLNLPISSNTSNSMIPINGKPVIAWILADLLQKGIAEVIVVCRQEDSHLQEFLKRAYGQRLNIVLAAIQDSPNIIHSLKSGVEKCGEAEYIQILLGDTLIQDNFPFNKDVVLTHQVRQSTRWCIVERNEKGVLDYFDKVNLQRDQLFALCGYYGFTDQGLLIRAIEDSIKEGHRELSAVLKKYQVERKLETEQIEKWYDFGNIDQLIASKQRLLQSRFFNRLSVHPVLNTITKDSDFDEKLRDELAWYEKLPHNLKVLTPRIISKEEQDQRLHLVQEYYGYPTLSELYLYADLDLDNWSSILRKLIEVHDEFRKYPFEGKPEYISSMYIDKTIQRLHTLSEHDKNWDYLLNNGTIFYNGDKLLSAKPLLSKLESDLEGLAKQFEFTVMHGDLCFSNILFDLNNHIVKLIDPRGSFGIKGIYGDSRYDLAKLRHSIHGLYDYIVTDLFDVQIDGNTIIGDIYNHHLPAELTSVFDKLVSVRGYKVRDIQLIEGLLFLSMLPLHQDKPKRQLMMYVQGLRILNNLV